MFKNSLKIFFSLLAVIGVTAFVWAIDSGDAPAEVKVTTPASPTGQESLVPLEDSREPASVSVQKNKSQ